jgi:hypothetical protein
MPGAISRLMTRGRAIPWARLYILSEWAYRKGKAARGELTERERSELGRLVRKSKGRRANLTKREVDRLRDLASKAFEAARRA